MRNNVLKYYIFNFSNIRQYVCPRADGCGEVIGVISPGLLVHRCIFSVPWFWIVDFTELKCYTFNPNSNIYAMKHYKIYYIQQKIFNSQSIANSHSYNAGWTKLVKYFSKEGLIVKGLGLGTGFWFFFFFELVGLKLG